MLGRTLHSRVVLCMSVTLALAACGGGPSSSGQPHSTATTSVRSDYADAVAISTTLANGDVTTKVLDKATGDELARQVWSRGQNKVSWTSADPTVGTIESASTDPPSLVGANDLAAATLQPKQDPGGARRPDDCTTTWAVVCMPNWTCWTEEVTSQICYPLDPPVCDPTGPYCQFQACDPPTTVDTYVCGWEFTCTNIPQTTCNQVAGDDDDDDDDDDSTEDDAFAKIRRAQHGPRVSGVTPDRPAESTTAAP